MKYSNKIMGGWIKKYVWDYAWLISIVPSALIAIFGDERVLRLVHIDVGVAMVGMSSAFLGIVLAGLAIFVVFLDKKYVSLLEQLTGFSINIEPFTWTAIIAVLCTLFGMGIIIIGEPPVIIFRFVIGLALTIFIYLLWQIYELVRFLAEHAKTRSVQLQKEEDKSEKE